MAKQVHVEEENEITAMWKQIHKEGQEKRAANREHSAGELRKNGIEFISSNGGSHLIVNHNGRTIDYWPGTGRWHDRKAGKGFGLRNLLSHLKATT